MLRTISWGRFSLALLVMTASYYGIICLLYYRREILNFCKQRKFFLTFSFLALIFHPYLYAQTADGNNGLSQANTMMRGYFDTATQLMYAIGAILGLAGAVRVFTGMQRHEQRSHGELIAWFGSCIFLVVVASVLKSFFGL